MIETAFTISEEDGFFAVIYIPSISPTNPR